jgi:hypothetical protein
VAPPNEPAPQADLAGVVRDRVSWAAFTVLVIMIAVAIVAILEIGKKNRPPQTEIGPVVPVDAVVIPPLELSALKHLPAKSNIVFAVQPGPLLHYAERTQRNPVDLLTKNGVPASVLGYLAKAGITLQQVDHFAGGIVIPDAGEEPRIAIVLVLHRPLPDENAFLNQLNAKTHGKGRFEVQFDTVPIQMARISDTIRVFGLSDKDLVSGKLPEAFRDMIEARVPKDAAIWIAAAESRWSDKQFLNLFVKKDWHPVLAKGRSAALGLSFGESPSLHIAVQCDSSENGDKLRTYFKGKATGEHSQAGGADDWATLDLAVDPKTAFSTIKGFFDDAAR